MQHDYILKLLALKADAQYLLRTFRKKNGLEETLEQSSKAKQTTRSQDCNSIIYYKHETKSHKFWVFFAFKNLFYDSKNY